MRYMSYMLLDLFCMFMMQLCGLQIDLKRVLGIYTNIRGGEGTSDDIEANKAGHKAWAALRTRMERQGLIETVVAQVNGKPTTCIRCALLG